MPIPFRCPHCGHQTQVARRYVGQTGPCARCGQTITVVEEPVAAFVEPQVVRKGKRGLVLLIGGIVLGVFVLCGGGVAAMFWGVTEARYAAARTQDADNLRQLGVAIRNYHNANGAGPPGTAGPAEMDPQQQLSWIARLLPYLDESYLYADLDFDQPWNGMANMETTNKPLFALQSAHDDFMWSNYTDFVGIGGVGLDAPTLPVEHARAGFFGYSRTTAYQHVTDGLSNTMFVAETHDNNGPWARGGTATIRALDPGRQPYVGDGAQFGTGRGVSVLMGDGSVRFLEPPVDARLLEALATINGNERVDF